MLTSLLLSFVLAIPGDHAALQQLVDTVTQVGAELVAPEPTGDQTADRKAASVHFGKVRELQTAAAKAALADHADALASGDGLFFRARLQMLAGEQEQAIASFRQHVAEAEDPALCNESKVQIVGTAQYTDPVTAVALFDAIDASALSEEAKQSYDRIAQRFGGVRERVALHGAAAPSLPVERVLNGADDFDPLNLPGKVVVVDFWATWCPPCRQIIPALVEDQAKWGDRVQVVGVTRMYTYGMDFAGDGVELPHGGTTVRELSAEKEIEVNETFIKAFKVNYPIVFTGAKVSGDDWHVSGIPTVFVIGKDGKLVGHVVGGGSHEELRALVDKALKG